MLGQASVHDGVVLVISVDHVRLQPLVILVADEALAILGVLGAVHLSVGAVVGTEGLILTHGVLHERAAVVHLGVDDLSTGPFVSGEGSLVNVENLEPGAHEVFLREFLIEGNGNVADHVLGSNRGVVN